jgi:hypothetical protein
MVSGVTAGEIRNAQGLWGGQEERLPNGARWHSVAAHRKASSEAPRREMGQRGRCCLPQAAEQPVAKGRRERRKKLAQLSRGSKVRANRPAAVCHPRRIV